MPSLHLLFSHQLTPDQLADAQQNLAISDIRYLPPDLQALWSQVPPDLDSLYGYATPLRLWLRDTAVPGDFVLIQGDFGLTFIMVNFSRTLNLTPIYATTRRESREVTRENGKIEKTLVFEHVRFREYR
ncbi:MAG: CRISPR-associated protein Csx20 [Bacteroidia bacterium]|nr:CRISPR-associated protein Csx20 [Bacteroidia bacterium]